MGRVIVDLTTSLDGYIAGPDDGPDRPLGKGGDARFTWMSAGPESNRLENRLTPPDASKPIVDECAASAGRRSATARAFGSEPIALEQIRVIESDGVTHLRYRVVR